MLVINRKDMVCVQTLPDGGSVDYWNSELTICFLSVFSKNAALKTQVE